MNGFKPCPFCGREDFEVDDEKFFNELQADSEDGKCCISIWCRCGCDYRDYTYDEHDYHKRIHLSAHRKNLTRPSRADWLKRTERLRRNTRIICPLTRCPH